MQPKMQLGMIGLGRMGANMVRRLQAGGHQCVGFDLSADAVAALADETGMVGATTLDQLVAALDAPRHIWLMVPAAVVAASVGDLLPLLEPGDTIIDGGNSWYRDDVDRAGPLLTDHEIDYLDVGTSGGVHGLERGYCLMVGGRDEPVQRLAPIFDTLSPGIEAAERTPYRAANDATNLRAAHDQALDEHGAAAARASGDVPTDAAASAERGWLHCGPSGAGHFVKMVHNGIEYGLMAAYAEGLNVLAKADIGTEGHALDAETAPLTHPEYYRYDLDLAAITEVWRRGSVVASWLLDLTAEALAADPELDAFEGNVSDSGEGRWTLNAAIDEGVPVPVLSAALYQRFSSRGRSDVADKVLSAMRAGFGGHAERQESSR